MALSAYTKRQLAYAMKSYDIGNEIAGVVDAGSGTLSAHARRKIKRECGSAGAGKQIADAVDAGGTLSDYEERYLMFMVKDTRAADEIIAALAVP